jgi:hypothetical protein
MIPTAMGVSDDRKDSPPASTETTEFPHSAKAISRSHNPIREYREYRAEFAARSRPLIEPQLRMVEVVHIVSRSGDKHLIAEFRWQCDLESDSTYSQFKTIGAAAALLRKYKDDLPSSWTTLSGTVSGAQLTSTRFTVAAGSIPDPGLATCSISGTGTQAATATSISGTLAMTFAPASQPCVGSDSGVNDTATDTWRLSLTN